MISDEKSRDLSGNIRARNERFSYFDLISKTFGSPNKYIISCFLSGAAKKQKKHFIKFRIFIIIIKGKLNSVNLPNCLRKPCFYSYSWIFDCNLKEIEANDIRQFKKLV
jgi:hypothetical protein